MSKTLLKIVKAAGVDVQTLTACTAGAQLTDPCSEHRNGGENREVWGGG